MQRERDGQFWYVLKARNGQVVATSEMYANRANAIRAARNLIATLAPTPFVFTYWKGQHAVTERVRC